MSPRSKEMNPPHEMDNTENRNENPVITTNNTAEDEPETTDIADSWAMAEGYTPLTDLNHNSDSGEPSFMMFSTGPIDSSDSENDGNENNDHGTPQGSFYVNPNIFGTTDVVPGEAGTAGTAPTVTNAVEDINFDEIAASALSALDEEYQQTLVEPRGELSSFNKNQQDEDLKIIAAGFDDREREVKQIQQQGGFVCQQWEENNKSDPTQQEPPRKIDNNVDTDAVRKAIATLSVKNKNNPFQQKFAAWQHNQQQKRKKEQDKEPHTLIPTTSYNIFHESNHTQQSRLASANLSRSATLAEAFDRLSLLSSLQDDDLLLIDIVGVDHVECESSSTIRNTFRPFVQWLGDYFLASHAEPNVRIKIHFRLIGRELFTSTTKTVVDLLDPSSTLSSRIKTTATCHSGVYHEFLEETCRAENDSSEPAAIDLANRFPDLAVAFNAGIWGYREWVDTIQYLALQEYPTKRIPVEEATLAPAQKSPRGLPMVITAYTLDECQEDQEVISQSIGASDMHRAQLLWGSEINPFGSQVVRETKGSTQEYRENACWQAWLLGRMA